jgi:hypothetical protein
VSADSGQGQLQLNGLAQSIEIRYAESTDSRPEAAFAYRSELIRHCLALLAVQRNVCLAGVQACHVARQWTTWTRLRCSLETSLLTITAGRRF